jgi:competence protein ComEA
MSRASLRRLQEGTAGTLRSPAPRGSLSVLLVAALATVAWWTSQSREPIPPLETAAWIDPHTAPVESLRLLPGIGPKLADRIDQARRDGAVFDEAEDLLQVPGIGPARVERLRPLLRSGETAREGFAPEAPRRGGGR